ncbi:MAG: DUF4251 domain-containing protein, partial [Bacteroidales bacterium]|nr:DUF4251 domain-containing protein [Bacteroidales bacterium]
MKKLIYILVLVMLGGAMQAQTSTLSKKEQRVLLKAEKKRLAEEEAKVRAALVEYMIKDARFVLEAETIYNRYGQSIQVSSAINFLKLDSTFGVIQVGSNNGIGRNGVGGTTVEGAVENYTYKKNEKQQTYTARFDIRSPFGIYTVTLNTMSGGKSEASISGNFGPSIRFSGPLVHPAQSRVYKG